MGDTPEWLNYSEWGQGYRNDDSKMSYPARYFTTTAASPEITIRRRGDEYAELWGRANPEAIDRVRWGEYDPRTHAERASATFWSVASSSSEILQEFAKYGGTRNIFVKHPGVYMPGSKKDWFVRPARVFGASVVKALDASVVVAEDITGAEITIPKRLILGGTKSCGAMLRVTQLSPRVYTAVAVGNDSR